MEAVKVLHVLIALGLNAVPVIGWFWGGWPAGTLLAVFWFENIAASLLIALRIILHRRLTDHAGHTRYYVPQTASAGTARVNSFLGNFLPVSLMFSAVHGVFLVALLFLLNHNGKGAEAQVDPRAVLAGCGGVLLWLAAAFALDVPVLRQRPFRWIEVLAERNMGRVLVVHMTLIIGMFAAAMSGGKISAFFAVFMALKTMVDLSNTVPQYQPKDPPRWLCALMDRVPNISRKGGPKTFAEFWRAEDATELARRAKNERPLRGA